MASLFTLEAVFAKKGDSLILHYGPWEDPKMILIDGGPGGVYKKFLRPRLELLREELELEEDDSLPFEMVMVSHIDDDHVAGIIDLFEDALEAKETQAPPPYSIDTLWHNSFDDIIGNEGREIVSRMAATVASNTVDLPVPAMSPESKAVVASTAQGRALRNMAKKLEVKLNRPFKGLVMSPAKKKVTLGHGLRFVIIGPDKGRVTKLQKQWDKDLAKILKKEKESGRAAAFSDSSPFNLASICVLAQMKGKSMLLTGDARGDFVLEGLKKAKLLKKTKPLHVDLLKVPHHGSDRNVTREFFERITADHYIVSGDGEHGNPERAMLDMLTAARGDDDYTVHFTVTKDASKKERNKKRKAALKKLDKWVKDKPANCSVVFRESADDLSIAVDLLDPLWEE